MIFSIITATYNAEAFIEATIQSVIAQNTNGVICEHIIVDGASTDCTVEIVKKYAEKYPDIVRYISEPDENLYDALNKGLKMARGTYMNIQGAGDVLKEGLLESLIPYTKEDFELIYGQILYRRKNVEFIMGREHNKFSLAKETFPHQAMFYHKKIYEELGGYDIKYKFASDCAYNIKIMGQSHYRHLYIDEVFGYFAGGGLSENNFDKPFVSDLGDLIKTYLGEDTYAYYKESGAAATWCEEIFADEIVYDEEGNFVWRDEIYPVKFVLYKECIDYIKNAANDRVLVFGAGDGGLKVINCFAEANKNIQVIGFLDNNSAKWNTKLEEYKIYNPKEILEMDYDKIVIASLWNASIRKQLLDMGISEDRIVVAY